MVRQLDAGMSPAALKPAASGEAITLDGELSLDVGMVAKWQNWNRQKVLLEAIRIGLPAVFARWEEAYPSKAAKIPEEEKLRVFYYDRDSQPNADEYRRQAAELDIAQSLIEQMCAFDEGKAAYSKVRKVQNSLGPDFGNSAFFTGDEMKKHFAAIEERESYRQQAIAGKTNTPLTVNLSTEQKSRKKK